MREDAERQKREEEEAGICGWGYIRTKVTKAFFDDVEKRHMSGRMSKQGYGHLIYIQAKPINLF